MRDGQILSVLMSPDSKSEWTAFFFFSSKLQVAALTRRHRFFFLATSFDELLGIDLSADLFVIISLCSAICISQLLIAVMKLSMRCSNLPIAEAVVLNK